MLDKRRLQIDLELEELEHKRDALLDERASSNRELLEATQRADEDDLKQASKDFMNELDQL